MKVLARWILILGCHAATCQAVVPEAYYNHAWKAEGFSSVEQSEQGNPTQTLGLLLIAKTVCVLAAPSLVYSSSKAEETLKKALVKWGRFQVVDDVSRADLACLIHQT